MAINAEKFMRVAAPLAAVAEGVISKGTTNIAPQAYQVFQQNVEAERKRKEDDEAKKLMFNRQTKEDEQNALDKALARKIQQTQLTQLEEKGNAGKQAATKDALFRKILGEAKTDEERNSIIETHLMENDPKGYLELKAKLNEPDYMQKLQLGFEKTMSEFKAKENIKEETELAKEERKKQAARNEVQTQYDILTDLGTKMPSDDRLKGFFTNLKAMYGMDADVQMYNDHAQAFAGVLAHKFSGEVGRLTDQDVERVLKMTLKATDSPEERKIKEDVMRRLVAADDPNLVRKISAEGESKLRGKGEKPTEVVQPTVLQSKSGNTYNID